MDKIKLMYDGCRVIFWKLRGNPTICNAERKICPLCKKAVRDNECIIMSTNHTMPNRTIHAQCFDLENNTPEYLLKKITNDWEQAQKYSDWFVDWSS